MSNRWYAVAQERQAEIERLTTDLKATNYCYEFMSHQVDAKCEVIESLTADLQLAHAKLDKALTIARSERAGFVSFSNGRRALNQVIRCLEAVSVTDERYPVVCDETGNEHTEDNSCRVEDTQGPDLNEQSTEDQKNSECQACIGFDVEHTCSEYQEFLDMKPSQA